MAKRRMDLETERTMKKELNALITQLLDDVESGRADEDSAQSELAEFRKRYGFTSEKAFEPYQQAALQKMQAERAAKLGTRSTQESESYDDDWPPPEPKS